MPIVQNLSILLCKITHLSFDTTLCVLKYLHSLTGLAYFLLERLNVESDERQLEREPLSAIFLTSITFTSHFEFRPQTHPARLLSFSWTLWTLIMASAYTANLASFLVSRHQVNFSVNTLEEALKSNIPVCVQRYSVMDEMLSSRVGNLVYGL